MSLGRQISVLSLKLAAAAGAGLVLAELVLRWVVPQPLLTIDPGLYAADPPGQYRLAPGYYGTISNGVEYTTEVAVDSRGFRSTGRPTESTVAQPPAGEAPLLAAIGDSFTFGQGVDDGETFVALLPGRLDGRIRVINAGLPGIGVPGAVIRYERHVRRLGPDVALLAIFLGNDLSDARPDQEPIAIVDGLIAPAATPRGLRHRLYDHSHLLRALGQAGAHPVIASLRRLLGLGEPFVVRTLRYEMTNYAIRPDDAVRQAVATTDEAIARLAGVCESDHTILVAALLPDRIQIADSAWQATLHMLRLDPAAYDSELPRRRFADLLKSHDVLFLDLTPAFTAAIARGETLYYRHDRHWNPRGHRLAAAEIGRFLAGQVLPQLDPEPPSAAPGD